MVDNDFGELEAREQARREVAKILSRPDQLTRLDYWRSMYERKQAETTAKLGTEVAEMVEKSKEGLQILRNSRDLVKEVKSSMKDIDDLCIDCQNLLKEYALIRRLTVTVNNLKATNSTIDKVLAIPRKVEAARERLKSVEGSMNNNDPRNARRLLKVHRRLRKLERQRRFALHQLREKNDNEKTTLFTYFAGVEDLSKKLTATMFTLVDDCIEIALDNPTLLEGVAFIIDEERETFNELENREQSLSRAQSFSKNMMLGAETDEAGSKEDSTEVASLSLESQFWAHLRNCFALKFKEKLEDIGDSVEEILRMCFELIEDLVKVQEYVKPCFPKGLDIFGFFYNEYHMFVYNKFKELSSRELSMKEILQFEIFWRNYEKAIVDRLGVPQPLDPDFGSIVDGLTSRYISHIENSMKVWLTQCVRVFLEETDPTQDEDGGLYTTPMPIDVFRFIKKLVSFNDKTTGGSVYISVLARCKEQMLRFQDNYIKHLRTMMPKAEDQFKMYVTICAAINDNHQCMEYAEELNEELQDAMDPQAYEDNIDSVDYSQVEDGFYMAAQAARDVLREFLFHDLDKLFKDLMSPAWQSGEDPVADICATFADFFGELTTFIHSNHFGKLVEKCLDETVWQYVKAMMTKRQTISDSTIKHVRSDELRLRELFSEYVKKQSTVDKALRVITDIRELFACPANEFPKYFSRLLDSHDDAPMDMVELLLDWKEVDYQMRDAIKDACEAQIRRHVIDKPTKGIFSRIFDNKSVGKQTKEMVSNIHNRIKKATNIFGGGPSKKGDKQFNIVAEDDKKKDASEVPDAAYFYAKDAPDDVEEISFDDL